MLVVLVVKSSKIRAGFWPSFRALSLRKWANDLKGSSWPTNLPFLTNE